MTLPYNRNFKNGRQSEQFTNDELHRLYEALKNINYKKLDHNGVQPSDAKLDGSLWFDKIANELKYYDIESKTWKNIFSSKFQITDMLLNETCPVSPVVGQLWLNNSILFYFNGSEWIPVKTTAADDSQWSNAAFSEFQIVTPLNPSKQCLTDVGVITPPEAQDYYNYNYNNELDYQNRSDVIATSTAWTPGWKTPELASPSKPDAIEDNYKTQFLIPNIKYDRIFVNNTFDNSYDKISSICIQYPFKYLMDKFNTDGTLKMKPVSAVHLNPGKITKIIKRLIKIDKYNSTINVSSYNTEFYGFRNGEYGGDFLIRSSSQDYGDYIPSGDKIILNYNANQNYDYVLAITYEFTWMRADGSATLYNPNEPTTTYYLSNLKDPINIHVNGLKLEETAYEVNTEDKTVTIDDKVDDVTVNMWSPYVKQFGYIRETDLEGRGIIRLREKVNIPLVFIGGQLIHPLYGGIERENDLIYIPSTNKSNSMLNMQWCVVDLFKDIKHNSYYEYGKPEAWEADFDVDVNAKLEANGDLPLKGTLSTTAVNGIYDYVLAAGTLHGDTGNVIVYNKDQLKPSDDVILFVDGLLINKEDILRDKVEGIISIRGGLKINQEYVLLKDQDGALYNSTTMVAAVSTGYLDDSLVYLNGKLLCNTNCVSTAQTMKGVIVDGAVDDEIKYFITDEKNGTGVYKRYNEYTYQWDDLNQEELKNVGLIVSSYENLLSSVKINIDYDKTKDSLVIYTYKLANSIPDVIKIGSCSWYKNEVEDGLPIYVTGADSFGTELGTLNVFKNGVKMILGIDYLELSDANKIKFKYKIDDTATIKYVIEPIEHGFDYGHRTVVLTNKDALQTNIYKINDNENINFYPGRLTVYVNGIRIPKENWTLLGNKTIMLKCTDYSAIGSTNNYPEETVMDNKQVFKITHKFPDSIVVEIRNDYARQEKTITLVNNENNEIYLDNYGISLDILESADEVLFYINGQFSGLSRNKNNDYMLDRIKGCISFSEPNFLSVLCGDSLATLFKRNNYMYEAWLEMTGAKKYIPNKTNKLTIVWR